MRDRFFHFNPHHTPDSQAPTPATEGDDWPQRLESARGDDDALLTLLREPAPLDVKLAAVEALAGEAALKIAEREFRDHDRRVHRIAKQRHTRAVAQREARVRAARVIDDARALSRETLIPVNHLVDVDHAWQAIDPGLLEDDQRTEYAALMAELAAHMRERADQPLRLRRWTEQARDALAALQSTCREAAAGALPVDQLGVLCATARGVAEAAPEDSSAVLRERLLRAAEFAGALAARIGVLETVLAVAPPPVDPQAEGGAGKGGVAATRDAARRWEGSAVLDDAQLEELLQQRFQQWQQAHEEALAQRRALRADRARERQRAVRDERTQSLAGVLERAEAALAAGHLGETHGHLVEIDKLLDGGASAGELRARVDALQAQYAQLKGWQHWGGGRARDELVQQAEALAAAADGRVEPGGVKLSLKQRAELIDDMRARWKELDRLGGATSRSLWQRFDGALKSAYAPVAEQIAAQRNAREQNLQSRERLLDELEAVPLSDADADADAPPLDPRMLVAALDQFQSAWRKLGPIEHTVPHKAREPLLQRMEAAVQRLEAPLRQSRSGARREREQLVERARALAAEAGARGGARDLVPRVRDLQAHWQQHARTQPLGRADENALWSEFRAAIDGVFSAREAQFQARDAQFKAYGEERAALIERLEALAPDTPPAKLQRALADVDAQWHRAGPAPRADAAALDARYRQVRDDLRSRLAASAQRDWHATCDALVAKLALCDELEGHAGPEAAQDEFAQRWSALPVLPEPLEQALVLRAGLPLAPGHAAPAALAEATDELLLKLEAAWGLDSPPAYEADRRALKLLAMKAALETRRPKAEPTTPQQWLPELLRRSTLEAPQRERLAAVLAALRRRGNFGPG